MKLTNMFDLIPALVSSLVIFGLFALFLVYAVVQTKKRKRLQMQLATNAMASPANVHQAVYPIKYATGKNFKSWIKLFPWEASGVLQLTDDTVVFQGATNNGQPLQLVFLPQTTQTKWIGRTFVNGVTSWFMLEQNGEQHYFTAETGTTVFGSKDGSQEILNNITKRFANVYNKSLVS